MQSIATSGGFHSGGNGRFSCGLIVHGVADDRAGHAVAAAAPSAQLGADDGDHLDAFLAQQRVGVDVAVVGEDHAGGCADEIGAAVPLGALAL